MEHLITSLSLKCIIKGEMAAKHIVFKKNKR